MAVFLLDTNVLSEFARVQGADERVDRWLKAAPEETLFSSIFTFAEIRRGIELLPASRRRDQLEEWQNDLERSFAGGLLPVTKEIGDKWAVLPARGQRRGTPLAVVDGLIAVTAIVHDLTLVTRNTKDFEELGVVLFNPWKPYGE